jgi:2'-5' RNA ligase
VVALRRVFVAVSLTDRARARIDSRIGGLNLPGKDVPPSKWHLTLRFIGGVEDDVLDRLVHSLDEADLGLTFRIGWGRLGAFPKSSRASVLWIGLESGGGALDELHRRVEDALEGAGIDPEDRPFRPHLTISRIRPQEDVTELVDSFDPIGGTMQVTSVELYESHLGRGGARYEVLESFHLG